RDLRFTVFPLSRWVWFAEIQGYKARSRLLPTSRVLPLKGIPVLQFLRFLDRGTFFPAGLRNAERRKRGLEFFAFCCRTLTVCAHLHRRWCTCDSRDSEQVF